MTDVRSTLLVWTETFCPPFFSLSLLPFHLVYDERRVDDGDHNDGAETKTMMVSVVRLYNRVPHAAACRADHCCSCRLLRSEYPHLRKNDAATAVSTWRIKRRCVIFGDLVHAGFFFHCRLFEWFLGIPGREPGKETYPEE